MNIATAADYPLLAIIVAACVGWLFATLAGTALVRAGLFPLPNGRRIGCIDGLRGYLALSVMASHFVVWMQVTRLGGGWSHPTVNLFDSFGSGGVALFFMTTGCVFYPRVLAGFRRTSWPATYVTRVFRIIPLIVASIILITAIEVMRTGAWPNRQFPQAVLAWITSWDEPSLVGDTDSGRLNAYVLWSLWYEWLFYFVILPFCAFGRDMLPHRLPTWVLPVTLLLGSIVLHIVRPPTREGMTAYLPLFAIGMIAYECHTIEAVCRILRTRAVALVAVVGLLVGMTTAPNPYGFAQMPLYGAFFICVACGNDMFGLLSTRGARLLGECSYGIYLLHGVVLSVLFTEGAPLVDRLPTAWIPVLLPPAAMAIGLLTPATFLLIERPAIRAGASIAGRLTGRKVRTTEPQIEVAP